MSYNIPIRTTRLRRTPAIRAMMAETQLCITQFIAPLFISETLSIKNPIKSMPGCFQLPLSNIPEEIESLSALGIQAVLVFGIPAQKDACGDISILSTGVVQEAIRLIRQTNPNMTIIADVCLCEYTDHGHCGILKNTSIDNAATLTQLAKQAVSYADAGADWVAPSSMTDGMVHAIRTALDHAGYHDVALLSYAAKYSSHFYGPFREAALGAPQFGDRKAYQMDPANVAEAIREAKLDISEGADLIMVKPAMLYLDIVSRIKQAFPEVPLCAYQVSGEYAMLKMAAQSGIVNEESAMLESLIAIKRAGADLIISYFAKDLARLLSKK